MLTERKKSKKKKRTREINCLQAWSEKHLMANSASRCYHDLVGFCGLLILTEAPFVKVREFCAAETKNCFLLKKKQNTMFFINVLVSLTQL